MGSFSIFHAAIVLVLAVICVVPFRKIFPRAGLPVAASALMPVPFLNVVFLWAMAFKRRPGDA